MASWYNDAWKERAPVSIDFNAGGGAPPASPSNIDWEMTIPPKWSRFWDNILSNGFDVILTDSLGNLLTFRRKTYDYPNKVLVLEVDNYSGFDNSMNAAYLYWNNPSAADASSVFVGASVKAAKVYVGAQSGRMVIDLQSRPSADTPATVFSKTSEEQAWIWFYVGNLFSTRIDSYQGRTFFESVKYCNLHSLNASNVHDATRVDPQSIRFINGWIGGMVKAGTNGAQYTVSLQIMTTENQIITPRCLLQIRDLLPPS